MTRFPKHETVLLDEGKFGETKFQIIGHTKKNGKTHYKAVVLKSESPKYNIDEIKLLPANDYDHKLKEI